ncbi:hypothetical protein [Neisseria zoodegmatis]|uniref:Uncharacterized protein n=1 Tax=Neisseria zoodegmatis TaxID=326523 RepID=A0AB38DPS9_9NEIS|nr:hypothetical protein [Neisseria zoodegmatis]OSI09447.1 hypothetical protein BWD10_09240 [Neisseria zoodegmatis]SNU79271.1 Uncharacterised protein [Neisseria zoodegmatis]
MTFEIGELHPNTPHLFSDLIELYILVNHKEKNSLSESDMEGLIREGVISPEENNIDLEENLESNITSAEKKDKAEERVENIFSLLEYRQGCFGEFYPFQINGEIISLKNTNFVNLTAQEKLYVILLACSRLRSFRNFKSQAAEDKSVVQLWAKYFTELSKIAFQSLLPEWASVYIFDANSDDRRNIFDTNLQEAMKRLGSQDMLAPVNLLSSGIDQLSTSGDAGLDLVGIGNFDDKAISNLVIFGQCGAQETNWPNKTLESHQIHLSNYFHMQPSYTNYMLIPLSYRDSNGSFVNSNKLGGTLLLDRKRILDLATKKINASDLISTEWMRKFIEDFRKITEVASI